MNKRRRQAQRVADAQLQLQFKLRRRSARLAVADVEADSTLVASSAAPLWRTVSLLGVAQIISWGTLYYTLTVLAAPIRQELGFSDLTVFGAFTIGQLVSGAAAPFVGRRIDRAGGRSVMTIGSLAAALALAVVAVAQEPILFTIGWMVAGFAMAACLYGTRGAFRPSAARRAARCACPSELCGQSLGTRFVRCRIERRLLDADGLGTARDHLCAGLRVLLVRDATRHHISCNHINQCRCRRSRVNHERMPGAQSCMPPELEGRDNEDCRKQR
jgi:hypothetical protein